ncbi:ribosome rescue protein RqcH [Natronomonas salsuginis]|jgi:predicted ribosome quality control (RQC) complex YloA/Tae2 family protein|uniref:Archaeal Rqc2 homolog aRqcH n=1 Tax=Natronomonas salsuginis TaxID=2217661 RepID=A0A4U5JGC6_9EURY|nr:ribosome rescue protein RqcH [Natronomonas salsuginis]TKR28284.1 fibronectin-binding domain-containing protein [Natronomonas salsuginis]
MDKKRAMTSVDLAALVGELREYTGAVVDKAYLYGDDFVRLKMRDYDRGRIELVIETGDPKRAHVAVPEYVPDAPGRPPNFAMMLRNRIAGANFEGVEQYGFDRILTFRFEREDATTLIVAELFGDGNVAVMNEDREVIDCLDTVRLTSRTVAPGSQYDYPDERFSPLDCDYEAFAAKMAQSDTDLVRTLATQLNFGGLYAEELCTRAGVEKTVDIAEATEAHYEALFGALERLREPILEGRTEPRLYEDDERVVDATPLPLEEHEAAGYVATAFESFNGAIDEYFHRLETESDEPKATGDDGPDFQSEIEKYERIIEQQEGAIEAYDEQADEEQQKAESLYGNYDLVDEICSTIRGARDEGVPWDEIEATFETGAEQGIEAAEAVVSIAAAEGTVTIDLGEGHIELDPFVGVEKNADRLYTEAKRVREKKEGAQAAIEDTRENLADVKRRREEWENEDGDEEPDDDGEAFETDYTAMASVPVRYDEKWFERFRWFRTSDGFLVLGGRNADQNEELVKKYMDPSDRFFHAQAHGAPVTILKATEPDEPARDVDIPDRSKREAAQFAVSYSSVWKDGKFEGDVYEVGADQVSKTPESGEYIEKGSFVIRGDREYYRDVAVGVAVGITCEPDTRVVGGPPSAIEPITETSIRLEPGQYAQNDIAKRLYRTFRERFEDTSFVRKIASADRIQEFCPPGGSRMIDE